MPPAYVKAYLPLSLPRPRNRPKSKKVVGNSIPNRLLLLFPGPSPPMYLAGNPTPLPRGTCVKFSSLFSGLFRSKSEKPDSNSGPFLDPGVVGIARVLNPQDFCTFSFSWFPTILPARRRKQISTLFLDKNLIGDHMTIF
ncbi:Uncharacterized protein Fot_21390 [Forsythia ovata]|uniref:Uncharacterized protein n=1 Tax=Forsythia ovata TaxID=205694 RepID=A0ABD1UUP4_9LAMI